MPNILMKCGCRANAECRGKPSCAIHGMFTTDAYEIAEEQPNLEGRIARCTQCKNEEPSSLDLAFFRYFPTGTKDCYYCGCQGWE